MPFASTINGFDLLLVLTIIGLIVYVRVLNHEATGYVAEIIQLVQANKSWQDPWNVNCPDCYGYGKYCESEGHDTFGSESDFAKDF